VKLALKSKAMYWMIVCLTSSLLLWGWSVALRNLINGTTVVS
jgi:hypothetical protein